MKITTDDIREQKDLRFFGTLHIRFNDENESVIIEEDEPTEDNEVVARNIDTTKRLYNELLSLYKDKAEDEQIKTKVEEYLESITYHYIGFLKKDIYTAPLKIVEFIEELQSKHLTDNTARFVLVPLVSFAKERTQWEPQEHYLSDKIQEIRGYYDSDMEVLPSIHDYLSHMTLSYIPEVLGDLKWLEDTNFETLVSDSLQDIKDDGIRDFFISQMARFNKFKNKQF